MSVSESFTFFSAPRRSEINFMSTVSTPRPSTRLFTPGTRVLLAVRSPSKAIVRDSWGLTARPARTWGASLNFPPLGVLKVGSFRSFATTPRRNQSTGR